MVAKLVLASSSPRREELLKRLGLNFTIVPSKINEDKFKSIAPELMVQKLAQKKAEEVAALVEDTIIIAADTIVVKNKEIIGKPENKNDAKKMLQKLQGEKHTVYSGITVLSTETNNLLVDVDSTEVYLRSMNKQEINNYINTGEPFDKAGSYAIQGLGGIFVEKINGSYFNVMGLPIHKLAIMLKEFGINII